MEFDHYFDLYNFVFFSCNAFTCSIESNLNIIYN